MLSRTSGGLIALTGIAALAAMAPRDEAHGQGAAPPAVAALPELPPITDPATFVGRAPPSVAPGAPPRPAPPPAPLPPPVTAPFVVHTIAENIRGSYVVVPIDMNKDGKTDLIALGQREDYLVWYENPYWTPHVIKTPQVLPQMVNMDAADLDGDGIPEIAVVYSFNMNPALSVGNIAILHSNANGDPTAPWTMRIVDQVPSPHRVRFADVDGSGKKALLVAPILNPRSQPVTSNDPDHLPTALYAYRAPDWKRELVSEENRGPVHGVEIYDWNGDGREETITSGQSGIYAHGLGKDGKWQRIQVAPGNPAPWPDNGASDVDVGRLGGKQFFVAIEPFHGNLLVVYTQDAQGNYRRNVIDNGLIRGHGLTLADFDRDGVPEIVAGGAGSANNLFFYRATDPGGQHWTKQLMDNELATDDCVTAHIKGDRKITDVICISGRAPNEVKWFEYVRR